MIREVIHRARRIKREEEERRCAVRDRTDSTGTSPCTAENSTGKTIEKGQTAAEPAGVKKQGREFVITVVRSVSYSGRTSMHR